MEFAIVLIPSLGSLLLLMSLAWLIFAWACAQEAVREGARAAVTCTPQTGLTAAVDQVVEDYSFGFVSAKNAASLVSVQYMDPLTLKPIPNGTKLVTNDVVRVSISGLPIYQFANIMWNAATPFYITASSADVLSCPSPATP